MRKPGLTPAQCKAIWTEARVAAELAMSEVDKDWMGPCGFAWINISGMGNFAKFTKENDISSKNYGGKGRTIWYSKLGASNFSQNIDFHEIACRAAAQVLRKYGIDAYMQSRMD